MRLLLSFIALFFTHTLIAQIEDPVQWSSTAERVDANTFDLKFTADIDPGWNIYSQYLESDDGPVRTSFNYDKAAFELVGKNTENGKKEAGYDELFGMNVIKLKGKVTFIQRVTIAAPSVTVSGYLEYMVCDKERCLPPTEEEFSFTLTTESAPTETKAIPEETTTTTSVTNTAPQTVVAPSIEEAPSIETVPSAPAVDDKAVAEAQQEAEDTPTEAATPKGIVTPVTWQATIEQKDEQNYRLIWTADMQDKWSIYSQFTDDNGPVPTSFYLDNADTYTANGKVSESGGKKKEGMDPIFGVNVIKFVKGPVTFTQDITVTDPTKPITGYLEFMTCDDRQCLPPEAVDFRFEPASQTALIGQAATDANAGGSQSGIADLNADATGLYSMNKPDLENPAGTCGAEQEVVTKASYGRIFVLGFLGGLLALLTPCVFPMIPLTVSFFTKSSENKAKGIRNATLYGLFILLVYLVLSIPFHLMDSINPDILNDISTNVWLNIAFFVIFVFFAFSFFGYYELTLPSSWTNRASSAEGIGGILGIFFMALTLALVSFSCTGPILGSLLAGALTSNGGALQLTAGMGGFGLALALPFALFAAFPGMMNSLPKSGGWLNSVKVVLGFLELALALKFLSNADLVKHWGLLKIEPFLGLWIIIFLLMGLYLIGKLKFPHDSPIKKLGIGRLSLGVLSFAFVVYLASGFFYDKQAGSYRPLKLLSGLAPPVCYSWVYNCDCPQNLSCFKDLDAGLAYAKEVNKPVMIDFTGHACVNCRKMEEHVWPEGEVYNILKDDYVLISLYVDDKTELPESEQQVVEKVTGGTRKLRTIGNKWSHFQTEYFKTNTQPYYVLMSPEGTLLNNPVGYTPDVKEYADFLRCGKDNFSAQLLSAQ